MKLQELPTPALLLDADIFESNIRRLAEHAARTGKSLRPHVKAHKCVPIAKRQIDAGAIGVCAATIAEVELMVRGGVPGVLLTSPVADAAKCAKIAMLAATAPDIAVVVDHAEQVRMYNDAANRAGARLNVLVDLDVGDHRTGIAPGDSALQLAKRILASRSLVFRGLQAYSVQASHLRDAERRTEYSSRVLSAAFETRRLLDSHDIRAEIITAGSTGSYASDSALAFVTELQAGSYALMDVAYTQIGGVGFGNAMTVLATVVSANHGDRVTVDAGFKAFSTDRPFGPAVLDLDSARYEWAGDEFGFVFESAHKIRLGDRLRFIPPHCDPTVNLYDRIHVCRGGEVADIWPIMDRWS
jgi:D-serine deaminase-like pyridoxal phosphate-dependent protein